MPDLYDDDKPKWYERIPVPFRYLLAVMLGMALCAILSCRPREAPPKPDNPPQAAGDSVFDEGAPPEVTEADIRTMDSILAAPRRAGAGTTQGLAYGLTNYKVADWCGGWFSGTMLQVTPENVAKVVQTASACQARVILVPARRLITTTGETHSPLSMSRAKSVTKAIGDRLRPLYAANARAIIGYNLADDPGSPTQWGGTIVTQAQIAEWAQYARTVLPSGLPLGIRVEPWWANAEVARQIDYAQCQYRKPKGNVTDYFNRCASAAQALGLKVQMTVNVQECNRSGSAPCTASELRAYGTVAVTHPANCADIGWEQTAASWTSALQAVHRELFALAKARATPTCRKGA
jgi:hypothetical protein